VEAAGAEVGADVARDDEGDVAGCSCGESSTWKHPGRGLDLLSSMGKLRGQNRRACQESSVWHRIPPNYEVKMKPLPPPPVPGNTDAIRPFTRTNSPLHPRPFHTR
jgi:hypothetical protein